MSLQVGECCCCPNLETGSKCIGGIEVVMGIMSVLWGSLSLVKSKYLETDNPAAHIKVLDYLLIIHGVCCILGGVVILIGITVKNIRYLERFLALLLLNIVIFTSAVGVQLYILAEYPTKVPTGVIIGAVFIDFIIDGFKIYFWIVIFSMYNYVKGANPDIHPLDSQTSLYAKWNFTANLRPL